MTQPVRLGDGRRTRDAFEIIFFCGFIELNHIFVGKKGPELISRMNFPVIFATDFKMTSIRRSVPGSSGLSSWDMVAWIAGVGGLKCGKTSSQLIERNFRSLSSLDFYFNYCFFLRCYFWGKVCSFPRLGFEQSKSFDARSVEICNNPECGNIGISWEIIFRA